MSGRDGGLENDSIAVVLDLLNSKSLAETPLLYACFFLSAVSLLYLLSAQLQHITHWRIAQAGGFWSPGGGPQSENLKVVTSKHEIGQQKYKLQYWQPTGADHPLPQS